MELLVDIMLMMDSAEDVENLTVASRYVHRVFLGSKSLIETTVVYNTFPPSMMAHAITAIEAMEKFPRGFGAARGSDGYERAPWYFRRSAIESTLYRHVWKIPD